MTILIEMWLLIPATIVRLIIVVLMWRRIHLLRIIISSPVSRVLMKIIILVVIWITVGLRWRIIQVIKRILIACPIPIDIVSSQI